jgi:hypothetical protein
MVGTSGGVRWWVCGVEQENGTFTGCVADLRVISGFGKRHCKGVGIRVRVGECGQVWFCGRMSLEVGRALHVRDVAEWH